MGNQKINQGILFYIYGILLFLLSNPLDAYTRSTSYPYISGDTWRFFCTWVLSDEQQFIPEDVQIGDTIFVEYFSLPCFIKDYLPRIKEKFILITPNSENGSDNPLPGPYKEILQSDTLVTWFLQNLDQEVTEKIIPLPIFLANNFWPWGNTILLDRYIRKAGVISLEEKKHLAYVNFSIHTNVQARIPCLNYFKQQPFALVRQNLSYAEYLGDLCSVNFVISPFGNGLDCHRTWEALLMGCYPVVLSSTLNPLYRGFPVVIVDKWEDVTEPFLLSKLKEFKENQWSREMLYAPFWFNQVRALQKKIRSSV